MDPEGWSRPDTGCLFVITGPSGVGKSTLIRHCLQTIPGLSFSVSATTRAPRDGETDGVDYHFLDRQSFGERVAAGAFLEHAQVYDRRYGTLATPTAKALERGDSLILDIDVQGSAQVRQTRPDAIHVFILPPSLDHLERRLRARGTDSDAIIEGRMQQVHEQLAGAPHFDYLVMNDDLAIAKRCLAGVLLAEMQRRTRRQSWLDRFRS